MTADRPALEAAQDDNNSGAAAPPLPSTPCRVLLQGWRFHSDVFWGRAGYADLHAHPRWDTWNQDHGFRRKEVRKAMEEHDIEGLDSITLVDP